MALSVTSSSGYSVSGSGKLTCDINVQKPAALLTDEDIIRATIDGAGKGFILGAFPTIAPGFITAPIGGWLGNRVAHATNETLTEYNELREKHFQNANAELKAAGCDESNTTYAPHSRGWVEK
jgi:hypothetical protein